jgi:hypothetical protein
MNQKDEAVLNPAMLKRQISICISNVAIKCPCYLEADTVTHCGDSLASCMSYLTYHIITR